MNEDLLDYWLRIIRPVFPETAWIASSLSHGDYVIQIDWRLEDDPHKSNRRSRKIQIIFKEKAIDNYLEKNGNERSLSDINMVKWISERYNQFKYDNDDHASDSKSTDTWRIPGDLLSLRI